jgi:hypothetical protein
MQILYLYNYYLCGPKKMDIFLVNLLNNSMFFNANIFKIKLLYLLRSESSIQNNKD